MPTAGRSDDDQRVAALEPERRPRPAHRAGGAGFDPPALAAPVLTAPRSALGGGERWPKPHGARDARRRDEQSTQPGEQGDRGARDERRLEALVSRQPAGEDVARDDRRGDLAPDRRADVARDRV